VCTAVPFVFDLHRLHEVAVAGFVTVMDAVTVTAAVPLLAEIS
jgi:hypothetical protein